MTDSKILVLDEGTTSTRAILFATNGKALDSAQAELTQHYPAPGRVEHDPAEIWERTLAVAQEVVERAGGADTIAAIGITNQRETVVAWDRETGEPLSRALVWQDRRTAGFCEDLKSRGHEADVQKRTGLLFDPYFSGTKMRWLVEHDAAVAAAAERGTLALGTIESWLTFKLTGGTSFVSDASNASRTQLLTLDGAGFDEGLCALLGVPHHALATVVDCAGALATCDPSHFGSAIAITGMAGDQQAATIGQNCLSLGDTKATFGTGAFVLSNMGSELPSSQHRLLGTVLYQLDGKRHYALEGSVFVAGSLIQWLRDSLGVLESAGQTAELAKSVDNSGGVVIVPALSGLGAPHWLSEAKASISGLSFATGKAEIARAALEAMAHQTRDLAQAFAADGAQWTRLKIDGGMSANDWMAQDLADIMELTVERPDYVETTALGAAMLAAVGCGIYSSLEEAGAAMASQTSNFEPNMKPDTRKRRIANWDAALACIKNIPK